MPSLTDSPQNPGSARHRFRTEGSPSVQLPRDLIETIFHFAAANSEDFCHSICKVSTWSRLLAQCYLFVTLTITDTKSHFRALQITTENILNQPSQLTPGALVHNIWMDYFEESFVCIFDNCPNLRNLAIWCHTFVRLSKDSATSRKQELHLFYITDKNSGRTADLFSTAQHSFIFPKIKRLQFSQTWDYRLFHLSSFSLLTHLALPCCDMRCHTFDGIDRLLKSAKNLEMLVVILMVDSLDEGERRKVENFILEKRHAQKGSLLYGYSTLSSDIKTEWFEETKGGLSIWQRAIQYTERLVHQHLYVPTWSISMLALTNPLRNLSLVKPKIECFDPIQLPHELIEIIFRFAAADSEDFCRSICELSTWTRALAQCHLFVTLTITDPSSHFRALQISAGNILHQPSQLVPGTIVQNIWIDHFAESFVCIFENCPNLKNLAICYGTFPCLAHAPLSNEAMSRKQDLHLLFIVKGYVASESVNLFQTLRDPGSFIPRITRLRFSWALCYMPLIPLSRLSFLTHLALPCDALDLEAIEETLPPVLDAAQHLKMLVMIVMIDRLLEWDRRDVEEYIKMRRCTSNPEERLYGYAMLSQEIQTEWLEETKGGLDIWERAVQYTEQLVNQS